METGFEEKEDERNETQWAWPGAHQRRACREQERMFHSSPSHTSRPAHQLSLSVGLSQHVPDASPSHLLHRQVATQDTRPSLSYRQTLLTDPSASVLAPY